MFWSFCPEQTIYILLINSRFHLSQESIDFKKENEKAESYLISSIESKISEYQTYFKPKKSFGASWNLNGMGKETLHDKFVDDLGYFWELQSNISEDDLKKFDCPQSSSSPGLEEIEKRK